MKFKCPAPGCRASFIAESVRDDHVKRHCWSANIDKTVSPAGTMSHIWPQRTRDGAARQ